MNDGTEMDPEGAMMEDTGDSMIAPVAVIGYRRPDLAARLMEVIREVKPSQLFVIVDGPKNAEDRALCFQVIEVFTSIDWPCKLQTNISNSNLGCRRRISSGLDWVFSQVDKCIIFEDDCIPHKDAFAYFTKALEVYQDNSKVMHLNGTRLPVESPHGILGSRIIECWGWATWKRAWSQYDDKMGFLENESFFTHIPKHMQPKFWERNFGIAKNGGVDSWAYRWCGTVMSKDGLAVVPPVNVVSNVGFDCRSTHCKVPVHGVSNLEVSAMDLEKFVFPETLTPSTIYESGWQRTYNQRSKWWWVPKLMKTIAKSIRSKIRRYRKKKMATNHEVDLDLPLWMSIVRVAK